MSDENSSDLQKCISEIPMDADEGPLINENSNGLSHLLTEGEFNSVDAGGVDESSSSNHAFLHAVELSESSVGDYLENNAAGFSADAFDIGDNAVTFPSDSLNNIQENSFKIQIKSDDLNMDSNHTEATNETSCKDATNDSVLIGTDDDNSKNIESSHIPTDDNASDGNREADEQMKNHGNDLDLKSSQLNNSQEIRGAEETEVVSEDELPAVEKPKIKDAENVSDDELPGPKPAELPADTEVVSEDELPTSKKEGKPETQESNRKRKNDAETDAEPEKSDSESSNKKQAVVKNGESKPTPAEKNSPTDEKQKKKLPELEKYWKVVKDDPTDFTGWTYLLQYVDQENDVEAAREAYDTFLSHYPYCYGYWRKYADYEKRKGSKKKCYEVLEKGLKAIPLSVDLWIHYLNHVKSTKTDEHSYIRSQYERAIETCGLEFRSDRLWESYIKWESENGSALNVTNIYDRLLATPTLGYTSHFDNFQEHVMSEPVRGLIAGEEVARLRGEVREAAGRQPPLDLPPGEDEPPDHVASEEEEQAIKERIIALRRKVHKTTGEEVAARWAFEEGIKRPYFHVKPLERCQLKNWKAYLDWEKQHGTLKRALVLHERCLIACALYEEFWMKLVRFLEEHAGAQPELVGTQRDVLERACTVHHRARPELHLYWAHFEEAHGDADKAARILDNIEALCPNLVHIQYRRVNLERRRGNYDKCAELYERYIGAARSKPVASALAIKYARFLQHVRGDAAAARRALDAAAATDPLNARLHLQRVDLALHTPGTPFAELDDLMQSYERVEGAEPETVAAMAWRRRELAEELGDALAARAAHRSARAAAKAARKRARHHAPPQSATPAESTKKKDGVSVPAAAAPPASGGSAAYYGQPASSAPAQYDAAYAQSYPQSWGYQQQPAAYHPHPWHQYPNYY